MARPGSVPTLRQLAEVRRVLRVKAEAEAARADAERLVAAEAQDTAEAAANRAEADRRAGVGSRAYPLAWLVPLGARVVERDLAYRTAIATHQDAKDECQRREGVLRLADASVRAAARELARAELSQARRREERRLVDRPLGSEPR